MQDEKRQALRSPLKWWITMIACATYGFYVVIVPDLYVRAAHVPQLQDTQKTSGIVSFVRRSKYGFLLRITTDAGQVHVFSCRIRATAIHDCIDPKYKGQRAEVWWGVEDCRSVGNAQACDSSSY